MSKESDENLGAQVRAAREALGLSRRELGALIGRHEANVGRIERGEHGMSEKLLRAICDALQLRVKLVPIGPAKVRRAQARKGRKAS